MCASLQAGKSQQYNACLLSAKMAKQVFATAASVLLWHAACFLSHASCHVLTVDVLQERGGDA